MENQSMILLGIFLLSAACSIGQDSMQSITLRNIWLKYKFVPLKDKGIESLPNDKHYIKIENNALVNDGRLIPDRVENP